MAGVGQDQCNQQPIEKNKQQQQEQQQQQQQKQQQRDLSAVDLSLL